MEFRVTAVQDGATVSEIKTELTGEEILKLSTEQYYPLKLILYKMSRNGVKELMAKGVLPKPVEPQQNLGGVTF